MAWVLLQGDGVRPGTRVARALGDRLRVDRGRAITYVLYAMRNGWRSTGAVRWVSGKTRHEPVSKVPETADNGPREPNQEGFSRMIEGRSCTTVARPVDTVYDFVVVRFFENYPRWSPEVESLRPLGSPTIQMGARGRQVRTDQGRRSETIFKVTRLEPGRSACFEGEGSASFLIRYEFEAAGNQACQLAFTFRLTRVELYMRPFEKLIRLAIQDGSTRTVRNIKQLVEREH